MNFFKIPLLALLSLICVSASQKKDYLGVLASKYPCDEHLCGIYPCSDLVAQGKDVKNICYGCTSGLCSRTSDKFKCSTTCANPCNWLRQGSLSTEENCGWCAVDDATLLCNPEAADFLDQSSESVTAKLENSTFASDYLAQATAAQQANIAHMSHLSGMDQVSSSAAQVEPVDSVPTAEPIITWATVDSDVDTPLMAQKHAGKAKGKAFGKHSGQAFAHGKHAGKHFGKSGGKQTGKAGGRH